MRPEVDPLYGGIQIKVSNSTTSKKDWPAKVVRSIIRVS